MLKKSTYIILALLLCIPLVLTIYLSISLNTEKPSAETLLGISFKPAEQADSPEITNQELWEKYTIATDNAEKVDTPLIDFSLISPVTITFFEKDQNKYSYQYYFTSDPEKCYFTNTKGEIYKVTAEDAKNLLATDSFVSVYDNYSIPVITLSVSGNTTKTLCATDDSKWHFKRGDVFSDGVAVGTSDAGNFSITDTSSMSVDFPVTPHECEISVYNGSTIFHNAEWTSYDSKADMNKTLFDSLFEKVEFTADTKLDFEIKAKWIQEENCTYYGETCYTSSFIFDVPATCANTPVDTTISRGEFTFLKLYNVNEGESFTLVPQDSTIGLKLGEARPHTIGDITFCYLPIPFDAPAGSHKVDLVSDGKVLDTFTLGVKAKTFNEIKSKGGGERFNQPAGKLLYNEKSDFDDLVLSLCKNSKEAHLWSDAKNGNKYQFKNPLGTGSPVSNYYGTLVTEDPYLNAIPYRLNGIFFETEAGKNVNATASGEVVACGENAYAGKYVIVDHGFGMLSIYKNLSDILVEKGNSVGMGSPIGKTGKTGYTFKSGAEISIVIDGVYINPFSNYNFGISF